MWLEKSELGEGGRRRGRRGARARGAGPWGPQRGLGLLPLTSHQFKRFLGLLCGV